MSSNALLHEVIELTGADTPVHPASEVKAGWSRILREVARHGEVIVTNHNRPQAVVVDIETYTDLVRRAQANDPLKALQDEFDRKLAGFAGATGAAALRDAAAAGILLPAARKAARARSGSTRSARSWA